MFDAATAREVVLENLPEPPREDKLEGKLKKLKRFNKRLADVKVKNVANEESKVLKVKADEINGLKEDKNEDKRRNDVVRIFKDNGEIISDMDALLGKNLVWSNDNDLNSDDSENKVTGNDKEESENETFDIKTKENDNEESIESKIKGKFKSDNKTCVNEMDEEYKAETEEFNIL